MPKQPRITFSLSRHMLAFVQEEAERERMSVPELLRHWLANKRALEGKRSPTGGVDTVER